MTDVQINEEKSIHPTYEDVEIITSVAYDDLSEAVEKCPTIQIFESLDRRCTGSIQKEQISGRELEEEIDKTLLVDHIISEGRQQKSGELRLVVLVLEKNREY